MTDEADTALGIVISITIVVFVVVAFMVGSGVGPWWTAFVAALGSSVAWYLASRSSRRRM